MRHVFLFFFCRKDNTGAIGHAHVTEVPKRQYKCTVGSIGLLEMNRMGRIKRACNSISRRLINLSKTQLHGSPRDRYTKPNLPAHPTQETMQTTTAMGGGFPFLAYKHTD